MVMAHFSNERGRAERLPEQSPLSSKNGSDESIRLSQQDAQILQRYGVLLHLDF